MLPLVLLAVLLWQDPLREPASPPTAEGPLANDCFLPVSAVAAQHLAGGDDELARARQLQRDGVARADAERMQNRAFEAWRSALAATAVGESVPVERGADDGGRITEGVEYAVRRRLRGLAADELSAWSRRFEEAATNELEAAGADTTRLGDVERKSPGTLAAGHAALYLGDVALEAGHTEGARAWYARGSEHVELAGATGEDPLARALAARLAWCAAQDRGPEPEAWRDAKQLVYEGGVAWPSPFLVPSVPSETGPGKGVRPGLVRLDDGRIAVQTPETVELLKIDPRRGLVRAGSFLPAELLAAVMVERLSTVRRAPGPPGWPLLPATDGKDLLLVQGRARILSQPEDSQPNALICVRPPEADPTPGADPLLGLPRLRWAVRGDLLISADGVPRVVPELAELFGAEFQPGPVIVGSLVVVQARRVEGEVSAYLCAFDLVTGELAWKHLLAKGADLTAQNRRFSGGLARDGLAGEPLARIGTRVFAGTHLGAGVLVDAVDGRPLWSLKNRRRDPSEDGWSGDRPLVVAPREDPLLLWAPADSDRLYTLRAGPLGPGAEAEEAGGRFARGPLAVGESEVLVGGSADEVVVLGRSGPERTVTALSAGGARRLDAVHLGREERFGGTGLASAARVLAPTDRGVYLFDRGRELYLIDYRGLPPLGSNRGGSLVADGGRIFVLGPGALWSFRAE